jgi:small subunit ribosomal protein S1
MAEEEKKLEQAINSDVQNLTKAADDAEEDFAVLLKQEASGGGRLQPGQKVRAQVIAISGDVVYIDLGGKSEGTIDKSEFVDEEGVVRVQTGDSVEAFFVSVQNGVRRLTTKIRGYSTLTLAGIRDAFEADLPVNGKVKSELKGGFEVNVGGVRCFCPFSQIDLRNTKSNGEYIGETFAFKVLEYGEDGKNVVLSRRLLLEEEKQAEAEKLKASLEVGMELEGKIRSIQKFGLFVDLGGLDGLVPASEIGWSRTENLGEQFNTGQDVTVRVIGIDWEKNRLTLSLKALLPDPWEDVEQKYPVDSKVSGSVVRLAPFGAFVNLEPGVDGLVHISNLGAGRRVHHPKEVLEVGQWVEAHVLSADRAARKLSLTLAPKVNQEELDLPSVGDIMDGTVDRVMAYGVFVRLGTGVTGLIPNVEMGTVKGTNHSRMFPQGTEIQVLVTGVEPETGKIRLSRSGVSDRVEKEEYKRYNDSVKAAEKASGSLGSLGDLLREKFQKNA